MAFEPIEESREYGAPITLYLFRYGSTVSAFYAYTDAEEAITHEGITYDPLPIDHGAIVSQPSLDKTTLEIKAPVDCEVSELFRVYPPTEVVSVILRQGHAEDPNNEFLVAWTGRIIGCKRQVNEAMFSCEPVATSMRRPGLRRNYMHACPHVLYGSQCRANKATATISRPVISREGAVIRLQDAWETPERTVKYVGGMVEWEGDSGIERRTILRVVNFNDLVLSGLVRGLSPGSSISISLGCDHQLDSDCANLHNNANNYGGQPWIPLKNPIGVRNNFY
jgi:hypothetical protein